MRAARCALIAVTMFAGACAAPGDYFDKWFGSGPIQKPAPLTVFKPSAAAKVVWQGSAGAPDKYVFSPAVGADFVLAAAASGQIVRFDAATGKVLARIDTKNRLSGGVGTDGTVVVAGTAKGEALALDVAGKQLWKAQLTSEILSAPEINQGVVVVRTGDGRIHGLDAANGARKWLYQRSLPALSVRTHVGVTVNRGAVFAGFAGGRLVALTLATGNVGWEATVALPKGATELERVADVSSLPVLDGKQVCAVAFQGRVACFEITQGTPQWARDVSSIAGMTIDDQNVYVSDEKSVLVAFVKTSGASLWKQDKLNGRYLSAPAVVGKYVAVGDYQGYVHFLSREDGSFAARIATDGSPIVAQPRAFNNGVLVQTLRGGVFAIGIQ